MAQNLVNDLLRWKDTASTNATESESPNKQIIGLKVKKCQPCLNLFL